MAKSKQAKQGWLVYVQISTRNFTHHGSPRRPRVEQSIRHSVIFTIIFQQELRLVSPCKCRQIDARSQQNGQRCEARRNRRQDMPHSTNDTCTREQKWQIWRWDLLDRKSSQQHQSPATNISRVVYPSRHPKSLFWPVTSSLYISKRTPSQEPSRRNYLLQERKPAAPEDLLVYPTKFLIKIAIIL